MLLIVPSVHRYGTNSRYGHWVFRYQPADIKNVNGWISTHELCHNQAVCAPDKTNTIPLYGVALKDLALTQKCYLKYPAYFNIIYIQ